MLFLAPAGTDGIKDHFLNGNKACLCGCLTLPITVLTNSIVGILFKNAMAGECLLF